MVELCVCVHCTYTQTYVADINFVYSQFERSQNRRKIQTKELNRWLFSWSCLSRVSLRFFLIVICFHFFRQHTFQPHLTAARHHVADNICLAVQFWTRELRLDPLFKLLPFRGTCFSLQFTAVVAFSSFFFLISSSHLQKRV